MPEHWQEAGFGLYVHWPFCASKCPYCDFNSHVVANVDQARWARAFVAEIKRVGHETEGRVLRSVFFGGGTPSLMDPSTVEAILDVVRETWTLANDCEITLEANPGSVEATRFAAYAAAGVNRVSMGVQALNDDDLRKLGRLHTAKEAMQAFDVARNIFSRVSFDLIYARQDQALGDWEAELNRAVGMAVDHLSLYQLTIEDGTAFGDRFAAGRLRGLPDEDRAADMWEATQSITENAGFGSYEVSNHAVSGSESRHNLIYWQGGDYAGIGPGAHGRITLGGVRLATEAPKMPGAWLSAVESTGSGENLRDALSRDDHLAERVMMGLRLREGISLASLEALGIDEYKNNIKYLEDISMLEHHGDTLRVTDEGRPVLNAVLRQLLGG